MHLAGIEFLRSVGEYIYTVMRHLSELRVYTLCRYSTAVQTKVREPSVRRFLSYPSYNIPKIRQRTKLVFVFSIVVEFFGFIGDERAEMMLKLRRHIQKFGITMPIHSSLTSKCLSLQ